MGELCAQKAHYCAQKIAELDRFELTFNSHFFKEFVVRDLQGDVNGLIDDASQAGFMAGVALGTWYPDLADCMLVAVTEKRTVSEIDQLCKVLQNANSKAEPCPA